ncbi:MAG: adenylyltransferase/cytidyltransferase family protein [Puniceicoccales bacterium]|jgi:D-beta-D-heptose 7-phosphate kinase/D-beta-D-heptose 1-phosphate adenosyltransferase|nr:adenylyltransferase/cytidyltransferase family protein [Puniceicoccales bacterium]
MSLEIEKLIPVEKLTEARQTLRQRGKSLVLTNGCFDLLHVGHVHFLKEAAAQADVLWVAVNSDASVRVLKGSTRPIYSQEARLYLLNALQCVHGLFMFDGLHLTQEMELIAPDIYVKAGDYTRETMHPLERAALEKNRSQILFLNFVSGWSTSGTIRSITQQPKSHA